MEIGETVEFEDCTVMGGTDLALNVYIPEADTIVWVPKSQIHEDSELWRIDQKGESGTLTVSLWWAEKEGLV